LVVTLAALYYNASLALNSVAGSDADLSLATEGISPTIIAASASTVSKAHKETSERMGSIFLQIVHWFQTRTLTQDGVMPLASFLHASTTHFDHLSGPHQGSCAWFLCLSKLVQTHRLLLLQPYRTCESSLGLGLFMRSQLRKSLVR